MRNVTLLVLILLTGCTMTPEQQRNAQAWSDAMNSPGMARASEAAQAFDQRRYSSQRTTCQISANGRQANCETR